MFKITKKISSNSESPKILIENIEIFKEFNAYILPNGMGKNRVELFRNSMIKNGARTIDENKEIDFSNIKDEDKFIIISDENTIKTWTNLEKALNKKKFFISIKKELERLSTNTDTNSKLPVRFVTSLWLTECLKQKCLIDTKAYEYNQTQNDNDNQTNKKLETQLSSSSNNDNNMSASIECQNLKRSLVRNLNNASDSNSDSDNDAILKKKRILTNIKNENLNENKFSSDSSYTDSEDDNDLNLSNQEIFENKLKSKTKKILDNKSWTCAHSSKEQRINHNKHITDKLEQISAIYENTKDKYRALGYQKAILILKRHPKPIQSHEEAIGLTGVGRRIADKIWEIIQTGDLRKLDELNSREDISAINLFTTIHGIGPTTAQSFVAQGFRTIDDLKTKANLTRQQKIGLKYYEEFNQRIPRDEVVKIEKTVKDAALSINNGLIVQACGSYRRGKPTCGDVDILITHPDGHSHKNIFNKLISLLHEINFLTDDLVIQDETTESQRKYLGVCRLDEANSIHRRLDIIVVPYDEYACALIYFTGSAHFNRSMRHLARKLGLSLCEKSLNKNVIRKGSEKTNAGERIVTHTEEDVFKILNIPYRVPEERDF